MFQLFWDSFNWLICMKIVITNNNNTIFSSVFHVASFRYLKPTSIISVFRKFLSFAASPCCLIYRVWTLRLTSSHITQSCLQELLACQTLSEAAKTTLNQNICYSELIATHTFKYQQGQFRRTSSQNPGWMASYPLHFSSLKQEYYSSGTA